MAEREGFETHFSLYSLTPLYTPLSVIPRGSRFGLSESLAVSRVAEFEGF